MTDTTYESILDHLDPSYWLGVRPWKARSRFNYWRMR